MDRSFCLVGHGYDWQFLCRAEEKRDGNIHVNEKGDKCLYVINVYIKLS